MTAYIQYIAAYIGWHKYFRDYVGIKGVDNMTSEEIMMAKTLAQNILKAENFDKEFIDTVTRGSRIMDVK